ncbi:MAG TPA: hypothetical protein VFM18_07915 [Methanosarcina sp.]|nr:hypothetical protein [Methanosarcina sp.]
MNGADYRQQQEHEEEQMFIEEIKLRMKDDFLLIQQEMKEQDERTQKA